MAQPEEKQKGLYTKQIALCIKILQARGLSRADLGALCGVSDITIGRFANGQREPSFSQGIMILKAAGWWIDPTGKIREDRYRSDTDVMKQMLVHLLNEREEPDDAAARLRNKVKKFGSDVAREIDAITEPDTNGTSNEESAG